MSGVVGVESTHECLRRRHLPSAAPLLACEGSGSLFVPVVWYDVAIGLTSEGEGDDLAVTLHSPTKASGLSLYLKRGQACHLSALP